MKNSFKSNWTFKNLLVISIYLSFVLNIWLFLKRLNKRPVPSKRPVSIIGNALQADLCFSVDEKHFEKWSFSKQTKSPKLILI